MNIHLNAQAQKEFDASQISEVTPVEGYLIWTKKDPSGRDYYGVKNFCGLDRSIKEDTDLSWLEWEGNEVRIADMDKERLFRKTAGIIKSWIIQLTTAFPDCHFAILASFDDGSALVEESDRDLSFTLRFWKQREGLGPDPDMEQDQPVISWSN